MKKETTNNVKQSAILRMSFSVIITIVLTFVLAGNISYWQGWLFNGIMIIRSLMGVIIFRNKLDLISERMSPGPGVKWWDKVFFAFYAPLSIIQWALACLDSGRFLWSPPFPVFVYVFAYLLFVLSMCLILWAMHTNKFFSSVVRVQTDRGQYVITGGPYQYVRHPGYIGALLMLISIPICLGSIWGLLPFALILPIMIIRTYLEDKMLQEELPGYKEFAKKTKYRLLPWVW